MSRFFATGSDSNSEATSSDDEIPQKPIAAPKTFQFDDTEEETKRVVRSAKDKRFEEIKNTIKILKNHKKIKDMANILDDFEELSRGYDKAKKIVEKEGVPRFYVRCLSELEDFINECWEDREGRKSMSKNNSRSLTTLRQRLKKYNRDFEKEIADYKESPDLKDVSESDEGDSDEEGSDLSASDDDEGPMVQPSKRFLKEDDKDDEDDDDDEDGFDSWIDESSSSSDEEIKYTGTLTADFFRKKATDQADEEKKRRKEEKREQRKTRQRLSDEEGEPGDEEEEGGWKKIVGGAPAVKEKPKMFAKDTEINHEAVKKKLIELASGRGKKSTDRGEQMEMLVELRGIAKEHNLGDAIDIKILFRIVGALYDYNPNIATSMKPDVWEKCLTNIEELVDMLTKNGDNIICAENVEHDAETFSGNYPHRVRGCALTAVERMDDEYIKMLQACDAHSTEYVERLKDENRVCAIIEKLSNYCEERSTTSELCRIYLKIIHHVYYKFDFEAMIAKRDAGKPKTEAPKKDEEKKDKTKEEKKEAVNGEAKEGEAKEGDQDEDKEKVEEPKAKTLGQGNSKEVMDRLSKFIYAKDTTDRIRTQALLCHIYHHGLHDRWFEARDLMLMSHLQDTIQHSDIPTQIMYNRAMVQIGLCAFRQGMVRDAHSCLVDIQSSSRAKELLAQGLLLQRQHERTPEQEKIEKRRQKPYHMHINLELLECVYLVSAMLLEIPYMAAHEMDARRRMISKNFHHVLRMSERQTLVGPPESMREHVVAASKAMKNGDWRTCKDYLINEKMNAKVWDLFFDSDVVRNMIVQKVKEESLRTYLFSYSSVYDSLDLYKLADMFDLELASTHSIISKMIINEELMASLDEPTKTVNMHRTEPTRLQSLALQLSEKVSSLMENNEKMVEMKQGGFYQRQNQQGGYQGGDQRQSGYKRDRDNQGDYRQNNYNRRDGQGYNRRDHGNQDRGGGYHRRDGQGGNYRSNQGGYRRGGNYRGRNREYRDYDNN